jgi:hypothetical protein
MVVNELAGAVGHQSALHKKNSGFAAPTLGRHSSTFRGSRILFSIRNPYINHFTNHFSIHSRWRALWCPTAPASRTKSRWTAEESRTNTVGVKGGNIDYVTLSIKRFFYDFVWWLIYENSSLIFQLIILEN